MAGRLAGSANQVSNFIRHLNVVYNFIRHLNEVFNFIRHLDRRNERAHVAFPQGSWPSRSSCGLMSALAVQKRPNHNMPRSAARQKMRFPIVQVAWQAVRLLLLDFPRILFLNGC